MKIISIIENDRKYKFKKKMIVQFKILLVTKIVINFKSG